MIFGPGSRLVNASRNNSRTSADIVGAIDLAHPFRANPAHGRNDAVVGLAARIERARGGDVLPACRRGIVIVDDQRHAVVLVEDGVADRGGQAVVPEPAIAEDRRSSVCRTGTLKAEAEAGPRP